MGILKPRLGHLCGNAQVYSTYKKTSLNPFYNTFVVDYTVASLHWKCQSPQWDLPKVFFMSLLGSILQKVDGFCVLILFPDFLVLCTSMYPVYNIFRILARKKAMMILVKHFIF